MSRFLGKQLERAEAKKVGRVECRYEIDGKGRFKETHSRADAKERPPLNPVEMLPVGRGKGVRAPGE